MFIKRMKPEETVKIRGEGTIKNITGSYIKLGLDDQIEVLRVSPRNQPKKEKK